MILDEEMNTSAFSLEYVDKYLNLKTKGQKVEYNRPNFDFVETLENGHSKIFVARTNYPEVFVYGAIQLNDNYEHEAGYVWSSRVGVLNKYFNKDYVDVVIDNSIYAMRVRDASKYLPKGYRFVREINVFDNEPTYRLIKSEVNDE